MRPPGKRLNPEDYWFIDGTAYDFSTFKHPGGDIALGLVKGRDATELFRSYHSFTNNHKNILRKYEVEKDFGPQILKKNYAFESEFYNEVRDRVKAVIDQIGTKHADTQRWMHIYAMLLSVLFTGYYFIQGAWWALPLFPICYWILNINTFHDASHFALSSNWKINHRKQIEMRLTM
jgi:delta11-fatty-acid desaturase